MIKWILLLCFPLFVVAQNDTAFAKAETLFKKEQYQQAKPFFKTYLSTHPTHAKTIEYLGDIEGYAENWNEAISYYEQLVEQSPENANYHYKYGGVMGMKALAVNKLRAATMIGDIKKSFETAASLDPKHIEARWALIEFYIQLPSIIGGSEDKAMKYADQLANISPVDGYLAHGYIAEYNDRPNDAEVNYRKAVQVGGSLTCYQKLQEHYEKNNKPEDALATVQAAQSKHKEDNRLHYQFGKIAGQYGIGLDQGISCLHKYIDNYTAKDGVPKDWAYLRLAQIYKHKGDKIKAQQWIGKALASRSDFKEALLERKEIQLL
ncbi:tetratricopeptide repeat protein [Dokdonia sp. R86516]|uniref:tetratricopeptide repeat protein n=1 Tax=Dokdonia sp. R86516 TaxID=3093856 RepID=UPI0037CAF85A